MSPWNSEFYESEFETEMRAISQLQLPSSKDGTYGGDGYIRPTSVASERIVRRNNNLQQKRPTDTTKSQTPPMGTSNLYSHRTSSTLPNPSRSNRTEGDWRDRVKSGGFGDQKDLFTIAKNRRGAEDNDPLYGIGEKFETNLKKLTSGSSLSKHRLDALSKRPKEKLCIR